MEKINKFGGSESGIPTVYITSNDIVFDPKKDIGLQTGDGSFAQKRFREVYKRQNFLTPNVLGYVSKGNLIIEVSTGTGMSGKIMYGITVIDYRGRESIERLNRLCSTWVEVDKYIKEL